MTIPSLQKIVAVENELLAAEQEEQGKAQRWLQEQTRKLEAEQQQELAELEAGLETARIEARQEAERKAAAVVAAADQYAARITGLDDETLGRLLREHLVSIITGAMS